jgi:hypothetical protein
VANRSRWPTAIRGSIPGPPDAERDRGLDARHQPGRLGLLPVLRHRLAAKQPDVDRDRRPAAAERACNGPAASELASIGPFLTYVVVVAVGWPVSRGRQASRAFPGIGFTLYGTVPQLSIGRRLAASIVPAVILWTARALTKSVASRRRGDGAEGRRRRAALPDVGCAVGGGVWAICDPVSGVPVAGPSPGHRPGALRHGPGDDRQLQAAWAGRCWTCARCESAPSAHTHAPRCHSCSRWHS